MANLTLATVRTNSYTEIFNLLQTGDNAITTNNIHPSYNNKQTIQEDYPQVIVLEPVTSMNNITIGSSASASTSLYRIPIRCVIEVYHNSSANSKTVADEVTEAIINGKEVLRTKGMFHINFEEDDIEDVEYAQGKSVHIYRITFTAIFMAKA